VNVAKKMTRLNEASYFFIADDEAS